MVKKYSEKIDTLAGERSSLPKGLLQLKGFLLLVFFPMRQRGRIAPGIGE